MQQFLAIFLSVLFLTLYGNAQSLPLSDASSEDCCDDDEDEGETDEDIIIMDEDDTNDDEGVNN